MPRRAKPSAAPLAQVRHHFGLDQVTIAAYLGIGAGMVGHIEAGRKVMGSTVLGRLAPLATQVSAVNSREDPAAHLAPPAAAPLAARLDQCQHEAARLRRTLKALTQQLETARRWQQALPALLAGAEDERARAWLLRRQEQADADLDGETAARYHLLRLRTEALETEAAELAGLLGEAKRNSQ